MHRDDSAAGCGRDYARRGWLGGLIVPTILILLGALYLLANLGVFSTGTADQLVSPLIFLVFGLHLLARLRAIGAILVALGAVLGLRAFGVLQFNSHALWPLVLICVGIALLFRGRRRANPALLDAGRESLAPPGSSGGNAVDIVAVLGGARQRITSQDFRGGHVLALCGGFELDLSGANFAGDTCVLQVDACCGGGEIVVPPHWEVSVEGQAILGGFGDETHTFPGYTPPSATPKRLVIRGLALLGGVHIKN